MLRVISGIQPTGSIHIGNYLGAIGQWVQLQKQEECIFFIADLHSLTIPYDSKNLRKNILETAVAYLSLGLDPQKSIFFVQSQIKEHSELYWLLSTIAPLGDLERMTQFKEKSKQFKKDINAGLLNYPILQAADILLYKGMAVPVGKDQVQHVEFARTITRKFNNKFGKTFPEPKALVLKNGGKIMSLSDPRKKMSKSIGPQSYISVFEKPKEIKEKIMSAVTDTGKQIIYNEKSKPGISNLLTVYSLFSDKTIKEAEQEFKGKGYAYFKKSIIDLLIKKLGEFGKKREEFSARKIYIKETLKLGAKKAQNIAENTIAEVRQKMGLI